MANEVDQFIAIRDQLVATGRLLTLPRVTPSARKEMTRRYREMAEALASSMAEMARRQQALAAENRALRARLAEAEGAPAAREDVLL